MRRFNMLTRADMKRLKEDRGPSDLTRQIEDLQKQKEYLQSQCRNAGRTILELNAKYEGMIREVDRLSEENENLKTMMKGANERDSDNNSG